MTSGAGGPSSPARSSSRSGSLVATLTPDVEVFVLARILEGMGGAAVVAAGLGMIAAAFPDPLERARATGWWGASVGAGIAVGPHPVDLARSLALLA